MKEVPLVICPDVVKYFPKRASPCRRLPATFALGVVSIFLLGKGPPGVRGGSEIRRISAEAATLQPRPAVEFSDEPRQRWKKRVGRGSYAVAPCSGRAGLARPAIWVPESGPDHRKNGSGVALFLLFCFVFFFFV